MKRKDSFGIPIVHNSKDHKIHFKSELEKTVEVENWKKHNTDSSLKKNICCEIY